MEGVSTETFLLGSYSPTVHTPTLPLSFRFDHLTSAETRILCENAAVQIITEEPAGTVGHAEMGSVGMFTSLLRG